MNGRVRRIGVGTGSPEGENAAYVLPDRGAVVDPGPPTEAAWRALRDGLDAADVGVGGVEHVLLTHWHADHAGLAPRLAAAADAPVHLHRADAPFVAAYDDARERRLARDRRRLREWGVPAETRDAVVAGDDPSPMQADARVDPLDDGDRVAGVEAIHTPGHTRGHAVFALPGRHENERGNGSESADGSECERGDAGSASDASGAPAPTLFVGDLLLPTYTPNVGGGDTRMTDPLSAYCDSLDRVERRIDAAANGDGEEDVDARSGANAGGARLRPGHGARVAAERIDETRAHHRERSRRVAAALAESTGDGDGSGTEAGPNSGESEGAEGGAGTTPWAVARALFGEMRGVHAKMGAGEAAAHLERLRREGAVERVGDDPRRYRPAADGG